MFGHPSEVSNDYKQLAVEAAAAGTIRQQIAPTGLNLMSIPKRRLKVRLLLLSSGLVDWRPQMTQKTPYVSLVQQLSRDPAADECYTPSAQVLPLLQYLDPGLTYYEATSGISSQLIDGFRSNGYQMVGSGSKDFFDCTAADVYDGIVTNPPYSLKDDFLAHCYALGKPFALFLPVASFQGSRRGSMFMKHGISALVYNNRVDFTGKGSPPFGNAWFIYGFIEPGQLLFANNQKIQR